MCDLPYLVTKGTVRDDKRTQKMSAKQDRLFTGPSLPLPVPQQAPVHTEQPETSTKRRINYSSKVPHPVAMRSSNIGTDTSGTLSVKRSKRPTYSEPAHQQDESSNPMQKAEIDAAIEKQKYVHIDWNLPGKMILSKFQHKIHPLTMLPTNIVVTIQVL